MNQLLSTALSSLINAGHSQLQDRLFSAPSLPEHPDIVSLIDFVLLAFGLLSPYLIPNPNSHEYKL